MKRAGSPGPDSLVVEETPLSGLRVVRPTRHGDERGFFSEVWSRRAYEAAGIRHDWCQDNHSLSRKTGTLRGLHYQAPPHAQAKLVRCARGRMWDVAVDVRQGSPTEGAWWACELSEDNWAQLLVPRGFLHGFLTLAPGTEVLYKVDSPYHAEADGVVAWDDPELDIGWPLAAPPRLSPRDRGAPRLADWTSPFVWEG